MLDPGSLAVLGGHFERLMGAIQGRVEQVSLVAVYPYPAPAFFPPFMKPFLVFNFFFNSFMVVVVFLFPGWAGFVIRDFSFVFVSPLPVEGVESLFVFAQPTPFILHSSIHQANHPRSTLLLGGGEKKLPLTGVKLTPPNNS